MLFEQRRFAFFEDSTISSLYSIDIKGTKSFVCFILEDRVRGDGVAKDVAQWKIKGTTAIPYGAYNVTINMSTRFKKNMIQLLDVPGFEGIRVHPGNTALDTEGCLITGTNAVFENSKGFVVSKVISSTEMTKKVYELVEKSLNNKEVVRWIIVKSAGIP